MFPGRIFGLIGPNGAGKTSTLRMIGTMLRPSSGNIIVNNYDTVSNPENVKKSLGFYQVILAYMIANSRRNGLLLCGIT